MTFPIERLNCNMRVIADTVGVSYRTVQRWQRRGLTIWQADRVACRFGTHPSLIWPDWSPR
jgi:transposase